jgi:hypothetical protein
MVVNAETEVAVNTKWTAVATPNTAVVSLIRKCVMAAFLSVLYAIVCPSP